MEGRIDKKDQNLGHKLFATLFNSHFNIRRGSKITMRDHGKSQTFSLELPLFWLCYDCCKNISLSSAFSMMSMTFSMKKQIKGPMGNSLLGEKIIKA